MSDRAIDVVCWDWNGTLLDDAEICLRTMNDVLVRRGRDPIGSIAAYRTRFCFPIRDFYASVGIDGAEFPDAADEYLALLPDRIAAARLHVDALSTVAGIADRGVRQVLASATLSDVLADQMRPHALADSFEDVLGIGDAHAASKDAVIAEWVHDSGVEPERILLIGDTNHDQEIAERLGARFVHFAGGHQHLDAPDRIGALSELLDVI
ncbi:phosphoglycolate phosphatase [Microbacterium sp. ZKA21]|uniref:HAD family hydrolase n=1 Tax=Microbacterium sp. ZKA21 TaxID=3381694 RepID=UPI003D1C9773